MTKADLESLLKTSPSVTLKSSTDKIIQAALASNGLFLGPQCRVKRICTKRDNVSKAVMEAHMEARAKTRLMQ